MTASSPIFPSRFCSTMLSEKIHGWPRRMVFSAAGFRRQRNRAFTMGRASCHGRKTFAQRGPRFLRRVIDDARLRSIARREDREKHQPLIEGIVGAVDFAHR